MADFEKLFSDNRGFIFRYLLKLCKNPSLAEELTQETFFRAYINIGNLRREEKAPVWLCQIAKNAYFAWYNENRKIDPLDEARPADDTPDMAESLAERELSERALLCLRELDEPYREVFMLSVFGGLSLKDISGLFGKSESWARVTFYRAKQKLLEKVR